MAHTGQWHEPSPETVPRTIQGGSLQVYAFVTLKKHLGILSAHLTERRSLYRRPHGEAHSGRSGDCRLRLFVASRSQSASFCRVRLSLPGQTWHHLTERRSLELRLTEKRSLHSTSHGKTFPKGPEKAHCQRETGRFVPSLWLPQKACFSIHEHMRITSPLVGRGSGMAARWATAPASG